MKPWTVLLKPSAQRSLDALDPQTRERVRIALTRLSLDPRKGASKLTNRPEWRFRVGDYRILYDLQEDTIVVLVLAISHRREA